MKVYFPTLYKMWIWCILIQAKPLWRFCSSSNPEKKKNVCMCLRQVSVREFLIWIDQSNKPPPFLLSCHSYFLPQITKPKSIDLLPLIKKTVHNAQRRRWKKWTHNSCFEWKPLAFKWSPSQYLKGVPITKGVQGVSLNTRVFSTPCVHCLLPGRGDVAWFIWLLARWLSISSSLIIFGSSYEVMGWRRFGADSFRLRLRFVDGWLPLPTPPTPAPPPSSICGWFSTHKTICFVLMTFLMLRVLCYFYAV